MQTPEADRQTDTTSFTFAVNPHILYDTSPGSSPEEKSKKERIDVRERRGGEERKVRRRDVREMKGGEE